ncbi:hypothetical protein CF70_022310 [Cupriavidus sp. SK-3]|nr:hypothetical protein CF70_022310 [Cupriavidus sp. SK-3]
MKSAPPRGRHFFALTVRRCLILMMTLIEAFGLVERLPARERLIVGRPNEERTSWSAGSIESSDLVNDLDPSVIQVIDEFRAGNRNLRVIIFRKGDAVDLVVAMGVDSLDAIADALAIADQERARRRTR